MKFYWPILWLGIAIAGACPAQPIWPFDRVLQATLQSHPALMAKRATQTAAQADQRGAQWQRYPSVSAEATTQEGGAQASLLRLEQPVWTGGRITAGINAADQRLDAAGASIEETRLDLTLKVVAIYTEALRQQARKHSAEEGLKEHERLLGMIRRRVEQEVSSSADQRLAEARMYQASNDLSLASQGLRSALVQMTQLAGAPVAELEPLDGITSLPASDIEAAVAAALAYSPTLRRLAFEEAAASADISSKRSAFMPQVVARLERNIGQQVSDTRASLVLLAQPGAGLSAITGVDAALAKKEAAAMAREAAARDVRERVTLDWDEWMGAKQRLGNARLSRTMSTEVFASYTRQYVTGRKSWIDVLNAVREATQSEMALADALTQVSAAGLRLQALTGSLTTVNAQKP